MGGGWYKKREREKKGMKTRSWDRGLFCCRELFSRGRVATAEGVAKCLNFKSENDSLLIQSISLAFFCWMTFVSVCSVSFFGKKQNM